MIGHWDIYIFPGGKVGTRKTRFGVKVWMWLNVWRMGERRAIHSLTNEHIVR
jgi:hypothetical protein